MVQKTILSIAREGESLDYLDRIIALASDGGCHLGFAVFGVALPPPPAVAYAAPLDAWMEERDEIERSIAATAREIEAVLQKAEISGDVSRHYVVAGGVSSLVGLRARYADLAVVFAGKDQDARFRKDVFGGLIFEGGIPFLTAPGGARLSLKPESVVVAWNGSLEAARAVHAALGMLSEAGAVSIAMVDPKETEWQSGEEPGFDIASYLARHGVRAEVHRLSSGGKSVSEVLLRHAQDRAAGMVVMGAYGHSRLREYIFGGTTLEMLDQAEVPVLMMR